MKAVMANVPEHILVCRRRTGADQWDEMWEGVLHIALSPNRDHQDFELALAMWLRQKWGEPNGCRVYTRINVAEPGSWPDNFRIPDIVLLTPARFRIDCNEYFDGGPDIVVEIRSPGDETNEKLPFYALVGVGEVWVIDRDSKRPEVYELVAGEFQQRQAGAAGWIRSKAADIELRGVEGDELEIRLSGRDDTRGPTAMKMIFAVIQPTKLDAVQQALARLDVTRMTVGDAMGYARQRGQLETYRGHEYKTNLLRKIALEIAVNDDFVDRTVECLEEVARTSTEGHIGDGKIFVVPMEQAIQISDGYRGKGAI